MLTFFIKKDTKTPHTSKFHFQIINTRWILVQKVTGLKKSIHLNSVLRKGISQGFGKEANAVDETKVSLMTK